MSQRHPEYSLGNSKPLINREQNYVLDRKLVTVHSEDRDITKWPNSNTFEIMLPEQLLNVQSMRLIQATMPSNFFVFASRDEIAFLSDNSRDGSCVSFDLFYDSASVRPDLNKSILSSSVTPTFFVESQRAKVGHGSLSKGSFLI